MRMDGLVRSLSLAPIITLSVAFFARLLSLTRVLCLHPSCATFVHGKTCAFSHRGDYVIAGSAQEAQHHIYVWDREKGTLVRMLEGPKEGLLDVQWHPARPVIASISTFGIVYIWAITATEHWSSFAPDFTELEENQVCCFTS